MQDMADKVLEIFSVAEPDQLPHVVSSPSMLKADPDSAMTHLRQLEASGAPSITLSLCIASLALRKGDLHTYRQQMDRHAEVLHEEFCTILNILDLYLVSLKTLNTLKCGTNSFWWNTDSEWVTLTEQIFTITSQ